MIPEKLWEKFEDYIWKGRVYSERWWVEYRVKMIEKDMKALEGKDVLEIGMNAGIFMWSILEVAATYTGIEKNPEYFQQAEAVISQRNQEILYNAGLSD